MSIFLRLPVMVLVAIGAALLGTDRLMRPLTDAEKSELGALLREHDYPGAYLVALRFALRLTRARAAALDLMGRVELRLLRLGWDPSEVSLARCLCRLTWSEWTHVASESDKIRRAEETYLQERESREGGSALPVEHSLSSTRVENETEDRAKAQLGKLRAPFEAAGDTVNLLWLDAAVAGEQGMPDVKKLAGESGRDVTEFYAAAKRRKRTVLRLLAEERGVDVED